ncbi:3-oxoacyl-ACP reductase [Moraxella caviae]|uniref:3-oxoacyl-ACP reductase n=1 Tax=Moraxella caviae TaxID=34060 RepID=A0A1T0A020_9GAMM|nr:3-oxoacyl-ACP reductase [Moraxella caviae]OOR88531.1 3-oxoacyl-ACP reductase [Moraxella caviae]STZ14943.1 3-oxoacyl-[acyl-carrier-protein] reductase FabG [Moraxella caviae]VEW12683.1 3-oxoacyl-[acyl-carrier-protein] reductase FabG [Moraxella caviae]
MSDRYGELVQSPLGRKVAKNLGLPMPTRLDRYQAGQPVLRGEVAFGTSYQDSAPSQAVLEILQNLDAKITTLDTLAARLADDSARFKVAIFDASSITDTDGLRLVYEFFHQIARRIKPSGRIIIIARPEADTGSDVGFALAQRAVLGFAKSIAKEFKKGISANVLYVQTGAEPHLDHALRFFMSAKSAYVSGQPIYLTKGATLQTDAQLDDKKPLQGKKILVTGASRGIGEAVAGVLARDGALVYCLDVPANLSDLQKVAGNLGGQALPLDITAPDAAEQIAKACGVLDGVVHNAGVTRDKTLANMSEAQWDLVMNINLKAIADLNAYFIAENVLADSARIVCVSSISGIAGNVGQANYAMSKAGVIGLVQATAKLFDGSNRTINAVAPGFIETKMTGAIPFAIREAGRRMNSMSQGGEPVDVAETISWLLAPNASGLNGNVVRVCGQSILGA